ncbi:STAS domain-containing protein [Treponema pectinovorum]|uniref:STAS domain-containing protein n=1 Tax=Treponema pectinovorum TaxID=164 RepID=UPI0011F39ABE|nr:STAS domain-containing protein [Treponema pectinovorum]
MDSLKLTEKFGSNYVLYELSGVINSYTLDDLKTKVYSTVVDSNLVLDLSMTEAIDSAGVGLIMAGFNDAQEFSHKLYIMNPSTSVRQALEDTGFIDTFYFIHSVTEVTD